MPSRGWRRTVDCSVRHILDRHLPAVWVGAGGCHTLPILSCCAPKASVSALQAQTSPSSNQPPTSQTPPAGAVTRSTKLAPRRAQAKCCKPSPCQLPSRPPEAGSWLLVPAAEASTPPTTHHPKRQPNCRCQVKSSAGSGNFDRPRPCASAPEPDMPCSWSNGVQLWATWIRGRCLALGDQTTRETCEISLSAGAKHMQNTEKTSHFPLSLGSTILTGCG
jgi:hypothetical protein